MTVSVEVADPRHDPEPAGWSEFATRYGLHAPWHYPMMTVEARATGNHLLLAVATVGGRVVAGFAVMACRVGGALRPPPRRVRGPLGWVPRWIEVCHPWQSGFPGWTFDDDLDGPARADVVRAFERAVCRAVGPGCLGLFYRSVQPEQASLVSGRLRYRRDVMGDSVLTNSFDTMDDWVRSLSRGRRHAIRGQLRAVAADPDLVVRFAPARDDLDGAELAAMLHAHRASFGRRLLLDNRSPQPPEYLDALVRRPDVRTLTYHDNAGRLLAFAMLLDHPTVAQYYHWATLGREYGGRRHLYFDSYAQLVRQVVADRRPALSAGRGLPELKATLGFAEHPRCAFLVPRIAAG